jgi:methyl acetate hydrolase
VAPEDRDLTRDGRIDTVLRRGVDAGDMPGVVALAATADGLLYEGAAGLAPDALFRIASMTKTVTSVAAMQLVERGKLSLEAPVPAIDPALASPQVLDGFDAAGAPRLRPAKRPITLRHLLTHTAGFCYEIWDADMARYVPASGMPSTTTGKVAALRMPLVFDPGERWEYGINIDWVGRIVEAVSGQTLDAYFSEHIFAPLGMADTGFVASPGQRARQVFVHQRQADGGLVRQPLDPPPSPEFWAGGGGLLSTGRDYLTFLEMLLRAGRGKDAQILRADTVELMGRNHVGDLPCGVVRTQNPARSCDVDFFPGAPVRWGLGGMLNMEPGPNGRSAGTVSWAGLFNCYFWLDSRRRVAGLIMTQLLPFADPQAVALYGHFERAVYEALGAA